jgi:ATP-dependent RNA helicase DDX24/MAK5
MSSKNYQHLNEMSQIRFLVIDEADRMIQQGSFPELVKILDAIHDANPLEGNDESVEPDSEEDEEQDRMFGLPGIRGEAKVVMLGDILERIKEQQTGVPPDFSELRDDEFQESLVEQDANEDLNRIELPPMRPPVNRQTFIFSATLTLPPSQSFVVAKHNERGKKSVAKRLGVDGAIAEILEKTRAHGETKVVDLTSSSKFVANKKAKSVEVKETSLSTESARLPPGLSLLQIQCTQKHKDSHLYAYLVTTAQGASGPCLVFCNSIAGVRRVGATLQTLRLPVRMLHAKMEQVS